MQRPFFSWERIFRLTGSPPPKTTISPGSTSRTNSKPALSRAQLSEATAHPWAFFPMQRGRNPQPSRTAMSLLWLDRITREKAPFSWAAALATASSMESVSNVS